MMNAIVTDIDTTFTKKELNLYEPDNDETIEPGEIDLVFDPLLAFDKDGYRIGYGKGFYDRYLAECREDCIRAGFSYFDPMEVIDDRDEFDVPLDLCITPRNIYVF
jgi:5-formyltetrahydrofolate cyclo-ligase